MNQLQDDKDELVVRKIFVKHSVEKDEDLELFDTDAIIKDLTELIAKREVEARKQGKQELAEEVARRVTFELQAHKAGHIVDEWRDVARPLIYKHLPKINEQLSSTTREGNK